MSQDPGDPVIHFRPDFEEVGGEPWRDITGFANGTGTRLGVIPAIAAMLFFSLVAGLLIAIGITPVTGVLANGVSQSDGIFNDLPQYIEVGRLTQRNRIFANGPKGPEQIATVYDQNRKDDTLSEISPYLKAAAIDGEDKDFYSHGAIDSGAMIRALATNVSSGAVESGASTIAMQVVRNIEMQQALQLQSPAARTAAYKAATQDTLSRKLREIKLAIGLEKKYSKNQVFQTYLNIANFGGNTYGVEAAAETYFSTTAANVTPAEAASIIAIVQNPSERALNNPSNYKANQTRRNFILRQMYAEKDITKAQYNAAIATPVDAKFLHLSPSDNGCLASVLQYRWICDYIVNDVDNLPALGATKATREANWGVGGFDVYTTFNLEMESEATSILHSLVPNNETAFKLGGAISTVQPGTGKILIMAQNKDFNDTAGGGGLRTTAVNFNVDSDVGGSIGFQPGSAYKLFTVIDWLEHGHKLSDEFNASVRSMPMSSFTSCGAHLGGPAYTFKNDENEQGVTTVLHAIARSINSVFIQMAAQLDLCDIAKVAESLGVHNASGAPLSVLPSCIIGGCNNTIAPLTLAAAYAAIADQGRYCAPDAITKIVSPSGADLALDQPPCVQAVPAKIANTAAYGLQGVMTGGGTGVASNPDDGTAFMGKTGTTNNSLQTWTVASSRKAATAVWIGNISGSQPLRAIDVNGIQAALLRHAVFRTLMSYVDRVVGWSGAFPPPDPALVSGGHFVGKAGTAPPPPPHHHAPAPTPAPTSPPAPGG